MDNLKLSGTSFTEMFAANIFLRIYLFTVGFIFYFALSTSCLASSLSLKACFFSTFAFH
jgi:hypothetical protein